MRRRSASTLLVGMLGLSLLASLVLMGLATQDLVDFGQLYLVLLIVNCVGIVTFVILIALNLRGLIRQLRSHAPGARLALRMVGIFTVLSVTPVLIVYSFSMDFLRRGIDSWFDLRVEQALTDALELSRSALDLRMRELLRLTQQLAEELVETSTPVMPLNLDDLRGPGSTIVANTIPLDGVSLDELRRRSGANELALLTRQGGVISFSTSAGDVVPSLPSEAVLLQLRQGQSYIALDPVRDSGLQVRVVVNVPNPGTASEARLLQALYPIATRMNALADNVQRDFARYTELAYIRDQLKVSFTMTLTLVLLFSIFAAVWAAFYSARRLSQPIRDLAEGTRAVAAGDYETILPVSSHDEMGFLVESFNEMTRKIAAARDEARRSRDQVDAERAYLEAVLGRLSSGVLSLDPQLGIRTANANAAQILGLPPEALNGATLEELCERYPYLEPFRARIEPHLQEAGPDWQEQVVLFGTSGRQVLMCRGTALAGATADHSGHVIVYDDITALIQGQRNAAWSEVARRLAHEIKNPLTPIQLSAERLRHKYLHTMEPADAEVLDRLTNTIVQQVETMKAMVNTFSEYARTPKMQHEPLALNGLIDEVLDLYRAAHPDAQFETNLESDMPVIEADAGRLRQVLNNLIKNALEASQVGQKPWIRISSRSLQESSSTYVEIRVEDRGGGIPAAMLEQVFEPYVTSKPKGTGLGLAIVKKIVEEHGGVVWMENSAAGGACATIRLPVLAPGQESSGMQERRRDAV